MRNMKRTAAVSVMMLALAAGTASAKTIPGTDYGEVLRGTARADTCPADGSPVDGVEDLKERVVELALAQDAQVLPVRRRPDELRSAGGIAALLRF